MRGAVRGVVRHLSTGITSDSGSDAASMPHAPSSALARTARPGDVCSSRMQADERRGEKKEARDGRRRKPDETAEVSCGSPKPEPRRPSLACALTIVPPVWKPVMAGNGGCVTASVVLESGRAQVEPIV